MGELEKGQTLGLLGLWPSLHVCVAGRHGSVAIVQGLGPTPKNPSFMVTAGGLRAGPRDVDRTLGPREGNGEEAEGCLS